VHCVAENPAIDTADYRRQARRIRANFHRDPLLRHQALGALAEQRNNQTHSIQNPPANTRTTARRILPLTDGRPATTITAVEQGFADYAATRLQPFGFTFTDRAKLLASAEQLGINRFRANLILALTEHHCPLRRVAQSVQQAPQSIAPPMLLILGLEVIAVGIAVLLFNLNL